MIHTFIGDLGHWSVIVSFVSALVSVIAYHLSQNNAITPHAQSWLLFARRAFYVHSLAVVGVIICLFSIIYNHYYQYHYAWSHSSNNLPVYYMISCFWEGQEGSFLLWIFWHVCLGLLLIRNAKTWEAPVMEIFALVQMFLTSMILGVVFFGEFKIGSSPFLLLREAMPDAPIFATDANFVPKDGTGLNPLLQNYWMVIHPPTLFLGFALTLVPFAFAVAALRNGSYKEWIRPALPWVIGGAAVLGIGIMMGAYWAYETLNFGGYWNWDPVENAVYVPWLVMVAALHVMITFQKSNIALKAAFVLNIATFILILYSTFLTRSGVLGEASVHSFTDLGLSGQLVVYLLAFLAVAVFYLAKAWKNIPTHAEEVSAYSREFWIFMGATVLCLASFQVIVATSIPAYNAFLGMFGITSKLAPPADQVQFYNKFQLWAGVAIALLSGTGQFFFWKKMDRETLLKAMNLPVVITMLAASVCMILFELKDWKHIILLTVSLYSVVSNLTILVKMLKTNPKLAGGSVAHIGIALMLLGILASAGYDRVVSLNVTGLLYNRNFSEEMNKENLLLFRNQPQFMKAVEQTSGKSNYEYTLTYKGQRMESGQFPQYIDNENLSPTADPYRMVTLTDLVHDGKTYFTKGDTIQVYNENIYYEIEYKKGNGQTFTLFPRVQTNPQMGTVPSPDIQHVIDRDLYTHITNIPDPEQERKWTEMEKHTLAIGDTFFINDYVAVFDNVYTAPKTSEDEITVIAQIRLLDKNREYLLKPQYTLRIAEGLGKAIPETNMTLGVKISLDKIEPPTKDQVGKFHFASSSTQKDWVIMKAVEKPFINILWLGVMVVSIGLTIAGMRRYQEAKNVKATQNIKHQKKQTA